MRRHDRRKRGLVPRNARETQILEKVLAAVSLSRREKLDLRLAAKIEGTRISTIVRYAPSAVEKRQGKYRTKPFDRVPIVMNVLGSKGEEPRVVRSSRSRSLIGRYLNAVKALIYKNDPSGLAEFRGKKVAGLKLITNIAKLKQLADAGLLSLNRLYAGVTRGR